MMKKILTALLLTSGVFASLNTSAQENAWSSYDGFSKFTTDKAVARQSFPKEFKLFNLDLAPLKQKLSSAINSTQNRSSSTIITLPNADGGMEQFEVFEASNFDAELQARFPEIRAFSGKGITDKYATLKLSISPQGIQTMVFRTDRENEFIEPYSQDHHVYAVFKSVRNTGQLPWTCTTDDKNTAANLKQIIGSNESNATGNSTGQLKTMRLAQSVTAEYSNYFGATSASQVGLVLAGINATLTRCNGVYERDIALHLNLVAASTNVIYYNASTDPYDAAAAGSGGTWNAQLQNTLTSVIGAANYDIGHLFGASGGGGNAGCIGCVCVNASKGSGFTSPADGIPQGDNFDIDYVVHEVGHQLGANHTFSMSNEGSGVNKEPGSGITIMGYAGITSQDLAPHSIDAYHQASIAQIQANLATKTCPVSTNITANNVAPVIGAVSNYTIPKSTPFALTATATDANGDALTYSWEQNDNASSSQTGASSVASATKATGPNWISFRPTASPTRYFPQLSTILAGGLITGPLPGGDAGANTEALSSVARTLNFRLTVRDNAAFSATAPVSVGQTAFTDVVVTVNAATGPFAVTAPNTAVSYAGGSTQNITWSVASTTASPVSCANVKISLSTDGGQTFPTVLVASTPNDGTEALVIPNTPTTTARIKVEAVGNIFFDISNANFTITAGSSCGTPTGIGATSITTSGATLGWTASSGAISYDVDYKLTSSSAWTSAATGVTTNSVVVSGLASSATYDWRVRANCASGTSGYTAAQFTTAGVFVCNVPSGLGASAITTSGATVSWAAVSGAVSYAVDYKLNSSSAWTSAATATTSTSVALSGLASASLYDWRVLTNCSSGTSSYASAQFTTATVPTGCASAFEPNETQATAAAITSGATNSAAISSATDVDYFSITTTGSNNIVYNLVGPSGVDFDLYIYNSAGTQLGSGTSGTATETVTLNAQAAGTYYIKVIGYSGANSTTCYTIKATATAVATGCQSAYDVSTNGTTSGAATIPLNTNVTGLISPSADVDNYKFVITTGGTITVTLGTLPGDYDLKLLNSAGTQVGISQNGSTTAETISYTAAAGTYYAQVYGYNGANSSTVCYTLKVATGTATKNETPLISKATLQVYPNPAISSINISLLGEISKQSTLQITDAKGMVVKELKVKNSIESINVANLAKGVYIVKVLNGTNVLTSKFVKQ
jgi:hypothetical protein